jgi:RND family efflux transporter MFP subunit
MVVEQSDAHSVSSRQLKIVGIVAVVVAIVVVLSGFLSRAAHVSQLNQWTASQAIPSVSVISPATGGSANTIVLPGRLEAFYRAPIYARVSGYLKAWYTDIGTTVRAGQLLGVIETPDLDQQLEQARANLATAEANKNLAESTAKRWQTMVKSDSVSQQAVDEKTGDLVAKQAIVKSEQASLDRLQALESFKRIVAPFDGVVTSRDTDVGALIDAGGGRGPQLFTVSDIHQLRLYVSVPQSDSTAIRTGMTADLTVPGHSGTKFSAVVSSTSGAVNVESGSLLVELLVGDNAGTLMPGDFANVTIKLAPDSTLVHLPASALIFRTDGLQVATVGPDEHVKMRTIVVQRDLGHWVEIASGVNKDDRVIDSPPDALADGDEVHVTDKAEPIVMPVRKEESKHEGG